MWSVRLRWLLVVGPLLLATACRGGGARGAAALPMPQDPAQWIAIAVFVVGVWWAAMKITRG